MGGPVRAGALLRARAKVGAAGALAAFAAIIVGAGCTTQDTLDDPADVAAPADPGMVAAYFDTGTFSFASPTASSAQSATVFSRSAALSPATPVNCFSDDTTAARRVRAG